MSGETFFTIVGCMDGRVHKPIMDYGKEKFDAEYPDTITGPGIVGTLAQGGSEEFLEDLKNKILISVDKHGSKGIIVDGHQECAGNPVDDEEHKEDIKKSIEVIKDLIGGKASVIGVFSVRENDKWEVKEVEA